MALCRHLGNGPESTEAVLRDLLEGMLSLAQSPIPKRAIPAIADFLFAIFIGNPFDLAINALYALCALSNQSQDFLTALIGLGVIPALAAFLPQELPTVARLNAIRVLALCFSLPCGSQACFKVGAFEIIISLFELHLMTALSEPSRKILVCCVDLVNRWVEFSEEWPQSAICEICRLYALAMVNRLEFLYPPIAVFVHDLVRVQSDPGIILLIECGIVRHFLNALSEGHCHRVIFHAVSAFLTAMSDEVQTRLRECLTPPVSDQITELLLGIILEPHDDRILTEVLGCYEKIGLLWKESFAILSRGDVQSALSACLRDGNYSLKHAAACCLFAGISFGDANLTLSLFSTPLLLDGLALFESSSPAFTIELLRAIHTALMRVRDFGLGDAAGIPEFADAFAIVLEGLAKSPDEKVQAFTAAVATALMPA
jgi:hypothetical protein